ncbi:hypothetical protein [Arthrobacter sp. NPDC057009]|uniref:hypothetical protein n=1 Tax=Arthrobacter sp. NPDC057009 TaxID=3345996 RepID=UPI0036309F0D
MKKTALGVLALAGTLCVQLATAAPSTASERPVTTKTVTKGEGLTAEFDRTDGCIQTRVSMFGSVFTVRGSAASEKLGVVSVTQTDICTLTTLTNGFAETDTLDLRVRDALARGHLKMSMEFTDFADPDNPAVLPMTVNVSFRATAPATTTSAKSTSMSAGMRFVSSRGTKSRPVAVKGTVTLGVQKVVAPDIPSYFATIGSVITKEKTVTR